MTSEANFIGTPNLYNRLQATNTGEAGQAKPANSQLTKHTSVASQKEIKMKLKVVLESSDEGGFTVYVPSLPGCISEGNTKEEALSNIKEAIELYMEPVDDDITLSPDTEIMEIAV